MGHRAPEPLAPALTPADDVAQLAPRAAAVQVDVAHDVGAHDGGAAQQVVREVAPRPRDPLAPRGVGVPARVSAEHGVGTPVREEFGVTVGKGA